MAQRIYQLEAVSPVRGVPGSLRRATTADRELVIDWMTAFHAEAGSTAEPRRAALRAAETRLDSPDSALYFWVDGAPVSMAGYTGPTPNGIRVGPVYTPPEHRRRGYASACVAALSQLLLDDGRRFCFLFTDLSNPTSNHIYQAIGYRPVCDVDEYRFLAARSAAPPGD
jgi:predicted GNAT family acetyltransferase